MGVFEYVVLHAWDPHYRHCQRGLWIDVYLRSYWLSRPSQRLPSSNARNPSPGRNILMNPWKYWRILWKPKTPISCRLINHGQNHCYWMKPTEDIVKLIITFPRWHTYVTSKRNEIFKRYSNSRNNSHRRTAIYSIPFNNAQGGFIKSLF